MKIEIDTHSHTLVSGHAYNTIREMAQMAAEKGLKGLAITEHAPEMPGSTHLFYFSEPADGAAADVRRETSVWRGAEHSGRRRECGSAGSYH